MYLASLPQTAISTDHSLDCKNLDPIYEELAYKYSSRNITIAKIDSYGQKEIGDRYQIESWPTIKFFDGSGGPPIDYESGHDVEWMSVFIDEWLNKLPPVSSRSPQIPMTSRPDLAELMKSKPRF
jgi:thiol-disulfide isomerase/thioredoxin